MSLDRRTFLKGMLGTAAAPLVAKAEIILPTALADQVLGVVPHVLENTRWLMLASTEPMRNRFYQRLRDKVYEKWPGERHDFIHFANRPGWPLKLDIRGTELWFYSAENINEFIGCEFTGAYFLDIENLKYLNPDYASIALSRTCRWPHACELPTNFEWPTVNDKIEALLNES